MNRIHRNDIETMCAVCGRTMLLGERLVTFQRLEGGDARVCELCIDEADARGWVREGIPDGAASAARVAAPEGPEGPARAPAAAGVAAPLDPDELPADPREAVEAGVELFNESGHPRTVSGIARTLGDPRVSVVQRNPSEVVVTVAWDLSWYQYRVDMLGPRPVTLHRRGEELAEIESRFQAWNATVEPDGTRRPGELAAADVVEGVDARKRADRAGPAAVARLAALVDDVARPPAPIVLAALAAVDDHLARWGSRRSARSSAREARLRARAVSRSRSPMK